MNIFQAFQKTCQAYPDKTCIRYKKGNAYESVTYSKLCADVSRLRSVLLDAKIKPGERVAMLLTNSPYWPVAFFAVVSIQAVAVPIDVQLSCEDINGILAHSRSRLLLTEEKFSVSLHEVLCKDVSARAVFVDSLQGADSGAARDSEEGRGVYGADKLAALFYTSGTTQEHKAVMLTHKNLLSNFASIQKTGIFTKDEVVLSLLPLHHTYPFMVTCLTPLLFGATVCYFPATVHHELFSALQENKVTFFVGVPQLFSLIEKSIQEKLRKRSFFIRWAVNRMGILSRELHSAFGGRLRFMVSGGAKLDTRVARSFYRWGFKIIEGYGLTETSPIVTFNKSNPAKFDSVGKSIPGVEVGIVTRQGEQAGEIAVKGDNLMLGYYRAPALTKAVFENGWFLTGDLGFKDRDNYLYITGRINELIILPSGKKINPEKIEAHYLKSPFIKEIAVLYAKSGIDAGHLVGVIVPDEEKLKKKGYVNISFKTRWELDGLSEKLPPYQRIKGFVLTNEALPRTRLGKLIRYKIEEKYRSGAYKQAERDEKKEAKAAQLSEFEGLALQYLSKILKKEVRIDDHLELDLGMDSLGRIELLSSLQELINVGIDDSLALELFQSRTVRDLIYRARQALPESAFAGLLKKDDSIFWPRALKEEPASETLSKLKLNFDLFDKFVSVLELLMVKFLFRVLFSVRVKGKKNIPKDGPFVIVANHVTYLDAFFVLCALPYRLILKTYFVGFGDIFKHPLIAWGMRFNRLIPIDANINLVETLKVCRYILSKDKILVYFPEGQRSIDGKLKEFRKGIGILIKESGACGLPMYLSGAYKAWPRSRSVPLPADVTVKIGGCVDMAGHKFREDQEPYQAIAEALREKVIELEKDSTF